MFVKAKSAEFTSIDINPLLVRPKGEGAAALAEADGTFLHVRLEHFLATPEGRAAGEAWAERLRRDA